MYARTYILNTNKRQTMRHHITNIALCGLLAAGVGTGLTSCDDFLTITPSSSIVEEDFWQDRNDLNSAVFACYKRMVDNDMLSKYIYWGEVRSDNFERSSTIGATSETADAAEITGIYNAAGVKVNAPVKGINIIRYSNNSSKVVIIK